MTSTAVADDPYTVYEVMRGLGGAVWRDDEACYFVAGYREVRDLLVDPRLGGRDKSAQLAALDPVERRHFVGVEDFLRLWLAYSDGPAHRARRKVARPAFPPVLAQDEREVLAQLAAEAVARPGEGPACLVSDIADRYAREAAAWFLGVPHDGRAMVDAWSDAFVAYFTAVGFVPAAADRALAALDEMRASMPDLVADGRSVFATVVRDALARDLLPADEVLAIFVQVLTGMIEPVATGCVVAAWETAGDPVILDALAAGALGSEQVALEAVRYDAPFHYASRRTREPVEIGSTTVPAGSGVKLVVASANRDRTVFRDADRFDPGRPTAPGDVLSFGRGAHLCLGRTLAIATISTFVDALFGGSTEMRRAGALHRRRTSGSTSFAAAPVTLHATR